MRVTLVEADVIGGGATAAGMGHLITLDDSEEQFALCRYSVSLWNSLVKELPADVEYLNCGTLWVATDEEEMSHLPRKRDFYVSRAVRAEILDSRALAAAEPHLRAGLAGGLLIPDDGVIYSPCAARFFVERAKALGAEIRVGMRVAEIERDAVRMQDGTRISASAIVNAAGAAAGKLTPGVPIRPRKGHLLITDRYPAFVTHQLVELGYLKSAHSTTADSVAFNVQPRATGQLLIGSSRQYGAEDRAVSPQMLARMLDRVNDFMPSLGGVSAIRTWTGFRAATPDKMPLIGPWPGHDRLYLSAGHEGLGITTSLGTAKLLVDQLLMRPSAIPQTPYLAARRFEEAIH
jgi:glycine/D-amino acid oxidase-like deaminating enzyme